MNESNNRKVLISVKVSTLLLIIITIIAVVILANIISNKLSETKQEQISTAPIDENATEEVNQQPVEIIESRVIQASVSSRSLEISRTEGDQEELHSIETLPIEEQEEIVEEPEVITTQISEQVCLEKISLH